MIEQLLLADRHLQVDQVDKAREIYQRVVDTDPGNAIAVVGLAQCALAEGEDQRAHELAARALEIDPENDMARRMEARLSEVMANRGEPVDRPAVAATPSPREMRPVVTEERRPAEGPSAPAPAPSPSAPAPSPSAPAPSPSAPAPKSPAPAPSPSTPAPSPSTPAPAPSLSAASRKSPTAEAPVKPPPAAKESPVRKSFLDRLMGR